MRHAIIFASLLLGFFVSAVAQGQSTITDRPFDLAAGSGLWGSFLPAYELGTGAGGGTAFRDKMDDLGYYGDLKAIRRFLGTRTSFEARGFYGYSKSTSSFNDSSVSVPNPVDGTSSLLSGGSGRFKGETDHYGYDIGLRDTWRTRFGGLSGGALFSYMAFDQTFDLGYGGTRLMSEKLNSDFIGGKGVFGWDGIFCGRPSTLDLAVGFYQLRTDYGFQGDGVPGALSSRLYKTPVTVEAIFSNYHEIRNIRVGTTFAITYLGAMPVIEHNVGSQVTLGTEDAMLIRLMFEILL
jgi:hypothetical protein